MRQRLDDGFDARTDEHRPNRAADGRDGGRGGRDDDAGAVPRPVPTTPVAVRVREWVGWFGPTRLVTSAVAVVVVCAGAWFLVRTPPPPSEADVPVERLP